MTGRSTCRRTAKHARFRNIGRGRIAAPCVSQRKAPWTLFLAEEIVARAVGAHGFGGVGEVIAVGGGVAGVGDELRLAKIVLVKKETVPNRTRR